MKAWSTCGAPHRHPGRQWMRSCGDRIGYGCRWLPDKPGGGPETDRGWQDLDCPRNDLGNSDHREAYNRKVDGTDRSAFLNRVSQVGILPKQVTASRTSTA